eukprot:gene31804-7005_t
MPSFNKVYGGQIEAFMGPGEKYDPSTIKKAYGGQIEASWALYNGSTIKKAYGGRIEAFLGPGEQKKGDQTDYGEYNILMLEFLAGRDDKTAPITLDELIPVWGQRVTGNWGAWLCTQSKLTLEQLSQREPYDRLGGYDNAMAREPYDRLGGYDNAMARDPYDRLGGYDNAMAREPYDRLGGYDNAMAREPYDRLGGYDNAMAREPYDRLGGYDNAMAREPYDRLGGYDNAMAREPYDRLGGYDNAMAGQPYDRLGGVSNAMAVRSAAALAAFASEEEVAQAARTMMFTHRAEEALVGGEFFTRVAWKVAHQAMNPREAIQAVAADSSAWVQMQVQKGITKFEEATDLSRPLSKEEFVDDLAMTSMARLWDVGKTEPIKVGKASPTEGTMPSSIYIILKYMDSFEDAVKANAMVGGDNASRAIAIGMVMGAYHGVEGIPQNLRDTLNAWEKCDALLQKLPLLSTLIAYIYSDTHGQGSPVAS